ncbi:MAG: hypothetical protein HOV80_37510 [Polyangiaceae bacterium]|nr:hypothetical protein [Polyangiaceae bacterium]
MSGFTLSHRLRPNDLADALDTWALRREKVYFLIDVRAAKQARQLARMCRRLAKSDSSTSMWEEQWYALRQEVAMLLASRGSAAPPPPSFADATVDDEDRPTRMVQTLWARDDDEARVA